jgi:hypothetical protein
MWFYLDKTEAIGSGECRVREDEMQRTHSLNFWSIRTWTYELNYPEIVKKGYISKMMSEYYEEI